jgi:polysaccharide export outer membrane protein
MDRRIFLSTLGALTVAGGGAAASAQTTDAAPASAPAATFEPSDYVLGAGDKLRLIVFGEDSLGGEFVISGTGKVSLPLIGDVQAAGKTVRDFLDAVRAALANGYLRDPKVSAEVLNYRPFYILGEVNKPGDYPYTNGLSVMNAIAKAGGFTYRANTKKVFIRRAGETQENVHVLDGELAIKPGDTVRVVERFF